MKLKIFGGIFVFFCFVMTFVFLALDLKYPGAIYAKLLPFCAVVGVVGVIPLGWQVTEELYRSLGGHWIVRLFKKVAAKREKKKEDTEE